MSLESNVESLARIAANMAQDAAGTDEDAKLRSIASDLNAARVTVGLIQRELESRNALYRAKITTGGDRLLRRQETGFTGRWGSLREWCVAKLDDYGSNSDERRALELKIEKTSA